MGDDITIGVTEIVNNIEVTAQPNDQIVDISVIDNADDVTLNITPTVIEINVNKGSSYAKWGTILGTLSDQEDLQDALDLKADLVDGKVPSSQLPSYVDDVIEVANYAALPATGESGKIYITLDTNHIYRWSGSTYIEITDNTAVWGAITGTLSSQTDLQNALNSKADEAITISTTSPLSGGGNLSANRTLSISQATANVGGYLTATDWNTFNNKQAALSGTGFVKISGTTISYDNNTYALDSAVVKLSGAQTISGVKTFSTMPILSAASGVDGQIVYADASNQLKTITNFKYNDATGVLTTQLGSLGSNAYTSTAYVPTSRTLTINGTAYDLSADRSWTINALPSMLEYNDTDKTIWNNGKNNIATNTSFGDGALKTNTSGAYNTAFGVSALNLNTTGSANTAVSTYTLSNNTSGYNNTGIGYESLLTNTTGYDNTGVGADALVNNLGGNSNSAVGYGALSSNTSGISNSSIGKYALGANTTGNYNVGIGDNAGNATLGGGTLNTTSSQSTYIGAFASCSANGVTNEIAIGYASSGNGSNSVTLGNTSITKTILRGSVGIGTTSPQGKLTVSGGSVGLEIGSNNTQSDLLSFDRSAGLYKNLIFRGLDFVFSPLDTERMRITSGGNVGIGTTSPSVKLQIAQTASGTTNNFTQLITSSDGGKGLYQGFDITNRRFYWRKNDSDDYSFSWQKGDGTSMMLITSDGALLLGSYSQTNDKVLDLRSNYGTLSIVTSATNSVGTTINYSYANGSQGPLKFANAGGVVMNLQSGGSLNLTSLGTGLVYSNGGTLTSTNPSDSRLKDNIVSLNYGLNEILQLRPVSYNWKNDTINQGKQFGFIAQEVQEVMPELVKEFTTIEDEEEVVRLGLDKEGIYAALVNAIKELKAEIEILKNK